jgi:hypothetical protein
VKLQKTGITGVGRNSDDGYFVMYKDAETVRNVPKKDAKSLIMWLKAKWYDEMLKGMPAGKDKWGLS